MAIALPGPDRLPPGPRREFFEALHDLYDSAGRPGARVISVAIRRNRELRETVSHETVSAVLRGASIPGWAKVHSIVVALALLSTQNHDVPQLTERVQRRWLDATGTAQPIPATAPAVPPGTLPRPAEPSQSIPPSPRETAGELPPDRRFDDGDVPDAAAAAGSHDGLIGGLPDRNRYFTGREILLDAVRRHLLTNPHAPLVLHGLGGAGKTQLAREYVHRYAHCYSVIWWAPAGSVQQARTSLLVLAERLSVPIRHSIDQTIAGVIGLLESRRTEYLLIFDGVDDDEVRHLLPSMGGHVVVTTRDPAWAHDPSTVALEIPAFDNAEAIQFLRKRGIHTSLAETARLTSTVGRLPLALEQVSALHLATGLPWNDLLTRMENPGPDLFSAGRPSHYPDTVSASLRLALAQLGTANPIALFIFELFAWFSTAPVSIALLLGGRTGELTPALARALQNPVQLRKAIADMGRYGLARLNPATQRIEVQPLIRLALRDTLPPVARERARENVRAILAAADPGWPDDLASTDMHRELAPHVLSCELAESPLPTARWAVYHQIRYRYLFGDYQDACQLAEVAVGRWRDDATLGPGHELVLLAMREWANALRALGEYDRARALTTDAMHRLAADASYGDDHPHLIALRATHATDVRLAGDYHQALLISTENHQRHLARYGAEDPLTAASQHEVAVCLRLAGEFARAEEVDRAVLARQPAITGAAHSRTLLSLNGLAEDLYGLGRYREAVEALSDLRPARPVLLGAMDWAVLLAGRTAALARRALGQYPEAVEALRAHYSDCVDAFGTDHEHTLVATMSYANALRRLGHPASIEEAHVNATVAVATYRRTFGRRNPLTLAAEVNLAAIMRARGERGTAAQADLIAFAALCDVVGEGHPFTIATMVNLATDQAGAGDHTSARQLSQRAYELARQVRGASHPDCLVAAANLSIDLASTGSPVDSEQLLDQTLAVLRRTLGPDHPLVDEVAGGVRVDCDIEPPST